MNKTLAIILLILGGIPACFIGTIGCIVLVFLVVDFWGIPCVLLLGGHVTGAVFLQRLYRRRGWLNKPLFWLCAGLPGTLAGGASLAVVMILDNAGYFSGLFAGLGEFLLTFIGFVYSGTFWVVLGIVLLLIYAVSRLKAKT